MNRRQLVAFAVVTGCAGVLAACAAKNGPRPPEPDPKTATLVALLPDPDTTSVGRATVSGNTPAQPTTIELKGARESTVVGLNSPPSRITTMSEEEVKRQFGSLLSALPPAPQSFTLYFRFESDELTAESRALVSEILKAVKAHPVPEVVVTGHTDTTGTPSSNYDLGMKRAAMVRALLADAGLDVKSIEVVSHGEAVLLVKTADDTYEPRNRRVEITIR
jgi:outer membrane protein OmpA-like peptidoglycan-associated protein